MLIEELKKHIDVIAAAIASGKDILIKYNQSNDTLKIQEVTYKKLNKNQ